MAALLQRVREVAVHLRKALEVMSTSVYTGLNQFNFICKHFLHICDEVQVFLGIFQQIAPALNRCIYCLLKKCIQQEKHVPQLKEP
jgi:hypothetical protein